MTFARIFFLFALFTSVQAFLSTPSLRFAQKLQLSKPLHPVKLRNSIHGKFRAQMPSFGEQGCLVPLQAQAVAAVAVQDDSEASSLVAIGLFTTAYIIFNGAVLFTVASVGSMLHDIVMQPSLPMEKGMFAGSVLVLMIGLCYVSTALTDLIEVSVGTDHWVEPVPEFLDAGAGI